MSIDEKAKELEEKYKKYVALMADADVKLVEIARAADKDFRYVAGLTEEQKRLALEGGTAMIADAEPELFAAYMDIVKNGSLGGIGDFRDEETLRRYDALCEEERAELLQRFHTDLAAMVVRCFDDVEDPALLDTQEHLDDLRLDLYELVSEDDLVSLTRWFHGLPEGLKDKAELDLCAVNDYTEYCSDIIKNGIESGNPLYLIAAGEILKRLYNNDPGREGVEEIEDLAKHEDACKSLLRNLENIGEWRVFYRRLGKEFIELDFNKLLEVYDFTMQNDPDSQDDLLQGVRENLAKGTGQQYVDYVLEHMKKGVTGGGNYRQVFARNMS